VIASEHKPFWQYALAILAQRDYCEQQIRQKLQQRDAPETSVEEVIQRLKSFDYLNELRFTQSFFRMQLGRDQALKSVAYKAKQRGVSSHYIDQVIAELQPNQDDVSVCKRLIVKRDPQQLYLHNYKQKVRVMRFLQRRGFDADSVRAAFFELGQEI